MHTGHRRVRITVIVDPSLPNLSAEGMTMRLKENSFNSMSLESRKSLFHRCFQRTNPTTQQCIETKKGNAATVNRAEHLPRISRTFYGEKTRQS